MRLHTFQRFALAFAVLAPLVWMGILSSLVLDEPRRNRTQVEHFVAGTCDAWSDIALIYGPQKDGKVVPYPKTIGPTLFKIQADFRKAYITHGCNESEGLLPKADPRVTALLPPGLR